MEIMDKGIIEKRLLCGSVVRAAAHAMQCSHTSREVCMDILVKLEEKADVFFSKTMVLHYYFLLWFMNDNTYVYLGLIHGLQMPNKAFFQRNTKLVGLGDNFGRLILGHLGYFWPISQHSFWYCESLVQIFIFWGIGIWI